MKKIYFLIASLSMSIASYAQYSNFNSHSRFGDNWSLGAEVGLQTNLNKWDKSDGAEFGLNLNKDFTPYFGLSLEALAGANNIENWYPYETEYNSGKGFNTLTGFLTGRWNITNSLGGFPGHRRIFEIETNVGPGYGRFYAHNNNIKNWNAFQFKAGLNLNFYVNEDRSFAINIRPAAIWNLSQTGKFDSRYAVAQINLGFTYHFMTSNGTHYFVKSDVSQLKDELAALTALNADLNAQWANRPIVEKEIVVEKVIEAAPQPKQTTTYFDNTFVVNFAFDSSELTPEAKANLDKVPTNATATVAGYASPEGNKAYNLKLSDRRADAVKNYLEARGVKVTKATGYGAENAESNRLVIVTID